MWSPLSCWYAQARGHISAAFVCAVADQNLPVMQAVLGGKANPTASDVTKILGSGRLPGIALGHCVQFAESNLAQLAAVTDLNLVSLCCSWC